MKKISKKLIKTWLIIGASSGIGLEISKQAISRGYNVVAVARHIPKIQGALCLSADVTNINDVNSAIAKAINKYDNIDVLINSVGISSHITAEDETLEHMKDIFEVNFFGTFNTCNTILPYFRQQKHGTMINITSQSGIAPRIYGAGYCSTKHAVEGFTGVIWMETYRFCRVMSCELGFIPGTNIYKNHVRQESAYKEYTELKNVHDPKSHHFNCVNKLQPAVSALIETIEQEKLPRRLILGYDAIRKANAEVKWLTRDISYSNKYTKNINSIKFMKTKYLVVKAAKQILPKKVQRKLKANLKR